jgi:gluconolactonase
MAVASDMTDLTTIDPLAGNPQVQKVSLSMSLQFAQGPLWVAKTGNLLVADTAASVIYQLTPPSTLSQFRTATNRTNGLALDPQGNLINCELTTRQITRQAQGGSVTPVASMYNGKPFNGPFDAIVRSDGTIYFTDPGTASQGFEGLYSIAPGTNAVTLLDQSMGFPDGIALSPDEKTLYVSASNDGKVYSFPVNQNGTVGGRNLFAQGLVSNDGIAIDRGGNVYVASMSGVRVYKSDGSLRSTLTVPSSPSNLSFGGADGKTLYITAGTDLYQVTLQVPGLP